MNAKLKNILRCYASGMGINETANTFHISRNTVRKSVRLFLSSGKTTEQLLTLSEDHLREMFGCNEFRHREPSQRQTELEALMPGYLARLSHKGVTVSSLFHEYKAEHPDGFQFSAFKRAVRQHRFQNKVVGMWSTTRSITDAPLGKTTSKTHKKKTTMKTNEQTAPATQQPDQNTISLDLMNRMKLHGMAEAFRESLS